MFKKLMVICFSCMLLILGACQSNEKQTAPVDEHLSASIQISVQPILDHMDDLNESKIQYVPEDGMLLNDQVITYEEGSTALDVLLKVTKDYRIAVDYEDGAQSSSGSSFVKGIGQIYNGDCLDTSGWMLKIDGKWAETGASEITIKNGQKMEWIFICDYDIDTKKY